MKEEHDKSIAVLISVLNPSATGFDVVNREDFEAAVKKAVETKDDADYRAYMKFFKLNKWGGI